MQTRSEEWDSKNFHQTNTGFSPWRGLFSHRILVFPVLSIYHILKSCFNYHTCSEWPVLCFASPLQSKALIPLQTEAHPETKQRVLTNYMFPQQPRSDEGKTSSAVPTQAGTVLVQVVEIKEREGFQMWFFVRVSLFWHVKPAVHM